MFDYSDAQKAPAIINSVTGGIIQSATVARNQGAVSITGGYIACKWLETIWIISYTKSAIQGASSVKAKPTKNSV